MKVHFSQFKKILEKNFKFKKKIIFKFELLFNSFQESMKVGSNSLA